MLKALKHIEYINGELNFLEVSKTHPINLIDAVSSSLYDEYLILAKEKNKLLMLTNKETKKTILIYSDFIKPSGNENNLSKRLHVISNDYNDINLIKPIGVYNSGDKYLYIYFSGNNVLSNNSKNNISIWVKFSMICYALENSKDIKYFTNKSNEENYFIYLTSDIRKILELNEKNLNLCQKMI